MNLRVTPFAVVVFLGLSAGAHAAGRVTALDVHGAQAAPLDTPGRRATILLFITNDCPIANSYAPELERIYNTYRARHVAFYLVYVDPALTGEAARRHESLFHYTCPALLDPTHLLVRLAHATVTPEAAVFDSRDRLVYHGRIDNKYIDYGNARFAATTHDLRDALTRIVAGKTVSHATAQPVGCYIADLAAR